MHSTASSPAPSTRTAVNLRTKHAPKLIFTLSADGRNLARKLTDANQVLRFPKRSFSWPLDVLLEARRRGGQWLYVGTTWDNAIYRTPLERMFSGKPAFTIDRGFGVQHALPVEEWERVR